MQTQCPVCLEGLSFPTVFLVCGHQLCVPCVQSFGDFRINTCMLCRSELQIKEILDKKMDLDYPMEDWSLVSVRLSSLPRLTTVPPPLPDPEAEWNSISPLDRELRNQTAIYRIKVFNRNRTGIRSQKKLKAEISAFIDYTLENAQYFEERILFECLDDLNNYARLLLGC